MDASIVMIVFRERLIQLELVTRLDKYIIFYSIYYYWLCRFLKYFSCVYSWCAMLVDLLELPQKSGRFWTFCYSVDCYIYVFVFNLIFIQESIIFKCWQSVSLTIQSMININFTEVWQFWQVHWSLESTTSFYRYRNWTTVTNFDYMNGKV